MRIEDPNYDKAEFVASVNGHAELHQAKRASPSGKWSLAVLGNADNQLLQAIYRQLAGNSKTFHFVSSSDAPELRELSERSRDAVNFEEFLNIYLKAKEHRDCFNKLLTFWSAIASDAFEVLKRIHVFSRDEAAHQEMVKLSLGCLFLASRSEIVSHLRIWTYDRVGPFSRDELMQNLVAKGYQMRHVRDGDSALPLVEAVTARYFEELKRKLIRGSLFSRQVALDLWKHVCSKPESSLTPILGKAGSGKSGCMFQLVQFAREKGVPTLAFRLDRLKPVTTTKALGHQLELEESPALVLSAVAGEHPSILIIDQLDAVSTTSGRNAEFLEVIEQLLDEVRGLRKQSPIHVVLACRYFDWENDSRFRKLGAESNKRFEVKEFHESEIKSILGSVNFDHKALSLTQMKMLCLPQNLALFLECPEGWEKLRNFGSTKDLFDVYWETKRESVRRRVSPEQDSWSSVLDLLTERLTSTQLLSVSKEIFDELSPNYINQMVSEGVLSFDGERYGFGHESFFDYCFARKFVRQHQTIVDFLSGSEQHLFRRAQVRQVLAYLRDSDAVRYCHEIDGLLRSGAIRAHIKDICISILASVPEVTDAEWRLLEPWISQYLESVERLGRVADPLCLLVWRHFFYSKSWFSAVCSRGMVEEWLSHSHDRVKDVGISYVRIHQKNDSDKVSALLEPYADSGDGWPSRLRVVMEWADFGRGRRFFDLFLRLVDNGVLDDARDRFSGNGTFWSMVRSLGENKPEWVCEVLFHWLRRRWVKLKTVDGDLRLWDHWQKLFGHENVGGDGVHNAGRLQPEIFVRNVLPLALELAEAASISDEPPPKFDLIWGYLFYSSSTSLGDVCFATLRQALAEMAKARSGSIPGIVRILREQTTSFANTLLMTIYESRPDDFAIEAVQCFRAAPWRFRCGYQESSHSIACETVRSIAPHCCQEDIAGIEEVILRYAPPWELSKNGFRSRGMASYELLSAIPENLLSLHGRRRIAELRRKFGAVIHAPRGLRGGTIVSPIPKESAERMTNEQWLAAIARYDGEGREPTGENFLKGGAFELSSVLTQCTKSDPQRFAELALHFPTSANPRYLSSVLAGVRECSLPPLLKFELCRKAFNDAQLDSVGSVTSVLGEMDEPLPEEFVSMLTWFATKHPDPEREYWLEDAGGGSSFYGGDMLTAGVNSSKGRAIAAISRLILRDADYILRFGEAIEALTTEKSECVRACFGEIVRAIAFHNEMLAVEVFGKCELNCRILATGYFVDFLKQGVERCFESLRPTVELMLCSGDVAASRIGAQLTCLAALCGHSVMDLTSTAIEGSESQRLGVVEVVAHCFVNSEFRQWCEPLLAKFFDDESGEVRRQAAMCFGRLEGRAIDGFEELIRAYCDSRAYEEDSFWLLNLMDQWDCSLPSVAIEICEKYMYRFGDEVGDIRSSRAGDAGAISKLVFRVYQQWMKADWGRRSLDIMDRMTLEGIHETQSRMAEFER